MDQNITRELIHKLPKTDLHCHLDGSLRIKSILEMAQEYHVKLPTFDEEAFRELVVLPPKLSSLVEYLKAFDYTLLVLQEKDCLARAAYELAIDAASENVRHIEIRFSPILHQARKLRYPEIVDAVLEGLERAHRETDISTGVIICGMRHLPSIESKILAELCIAYKNRGVVAFDLAGAEIDNPAKRHQEACALVLRNNINCTIHAGEAYGPESISQAIHYCGAHRIGHGTRLSEDGNLLNYMNDHRIPLEICLTSNVQTNAIDKLEHHPFRFYFDYNLRTTLNTDNRLMSNTTMTDEYLLAAKTFGLTLEEIKDIIICGFKSAFLPYRDKVRLLKQALEELDRPFIP
ncbi:MAG: adenosine deaminase [Planctomycetes bacterium]|jgi:adenosine deaminase|nr:adenosine deaminase [Planctomycetota bacterium]HON44064.1 adenosine deaminase [Planctomycetota bacterium]HPY75247.1 adenosine deaminase [Planctomycetota bacterium]HQB00795.1 adenosine deaminase [Planctomycetota bacterium]HRU51993.1 adenosine deaminase [Planctomycetota bacterium]